jgi:hypothetical protein
VPIETAPTGPFAFASSLEGHIIISPWVRLFTSLPIFASVLRLAILSVSMDAWKEELQKEELH